MNKIPISRILVGTDFSECADQAVTCAGFLATAFSAALDILHVVEVTPHMQPDDTVADRFFRQRRIEVADSLDELVRRLASDKVSVKWHQRFGIPSQKLNAAARDLRVDLVVVGTHGQTGLPRILLGSTAERIVRGAPCPVLTIRAVREHREPVPSETVAAAPALGRILCPIDFSPCSLSALQYAAQLVQALGASLTILHVLQPLFFDLELGLGAVPDYEQSRARAEYQLAEAREALLKRELTVQTAISGGIPSDSIVAAAQTFRCDLIVMGTHGKRDLPHFMAGSVAEAVLRRAPCPVLTVADRADPYRERLIPAEIALNLSS
jgi:nucleotide-binding universal stress UspA family protein